MALPESQAAFVTQEPQAHLRSLRRAWQGLDQEDAAMRLQGSDRMLCCWTVAKYPEHRGAAAGHEDSSAPRRSRPSLSAAIGG